jgi:hypothetical protein
MLRLFQCSGVSHEDTRSAVQGPQDEHTASAFPPRLRGREVGGDEVVLLDADVADCVESWLGSPQPLSGQRRERLEPCRAELDHVLRYSAIRPKGLRHTLRPLSSESRQRARRVSRSAPLAR